MKGDQTRRPSPTATPQRAVGRRLDVAQALAAAGVAAWRWHVGDGTISWSPGAADILGIPDLILQSPELLARGLQAEDVALLSTVVERAGRAGAPLAARLPLRLGPRTSWYDIAGRVLLDETAQPIGATGTAVEVTDRQQATEAIAATLAEAEAALDHLRTLALRWNPNTGLLDIRRQPPGVTLAEAIPAEAPVSALLDRMDEDDGTRFRDALALSWYDGRPFTLELLIRGDDGVARRMLLRARRASMGDQSDLVAAILD